MINILSHTKYNVSEDQRKNSNRSIVKNITYLRLLKCLTRDPYLSTALILDNEKSCNLENFPNNVAWKKKLLVIIFIFKNKLYLKYINTNMKF